MPEKEHRAVIPLRASHLLQGECIRKSTVDELGKNVSLRTSAN